MVTTPDLLGENPPNGARKVTVRDVLGLEMTLYEARRFPRQGGNRTDLVHYQVFVDETYVGGIESYWPDRDRGGRAHKKEFAALPPEARDWTVSGTRQQVLEALAESYLSRLATEAEVALEALQQRRELLLQYLAEADRGIARKSAQLRTLRGMLGWQS